MSGRLPLAGVTVLDLSRGAGPAGACARLLGQLGATVRAHDARRAPAAVPALAARADVTVTDLRTGEAGRLGLEPARLSGPGRAVVSVTPFGLDGPDAERSDAVAAAAGADPLVAAALTGAHAAAAGLAALRWARRHGRAGLAEVAAVEVVAACLGDLLPRATCPRRARGGPDGATMGRGVAVLPCADGYVGMAAPSAADGGLLAGLTGVEAVRAADAGLGRALGPWLATRTRDAVFHAAQLWRLPVVPVLTPEEVYADAQCVARGVWARRGGRVVARTPFRFTPGARAATAWRDERPHPDPLPGGEGAGRGGRPHPATRHTASVAPLPGGEGEEPALTPALSQGARGRGRPSPTPSPRGRGGRTCSRPAVLSGGEGVGPLADVCVLDLGMVWAGPWCGRLLAGLGARVVKVEGPARRDGTRPVREEGCAGAFADLNRGKASLVLDLASAAGRAAFLRLAAGADAVLENFSPRVMPNFGLGYAALAQVNPGLLMLSLPAFGASGPWRDYVAYGSGLELATGLAARVAGRPATSPVAYLDYLAGAYGAVALLAALLARDRSGRGAHVEVAQREVACQVLSAAREADAAPRPWALDVVALRADPHLAARGLFAAPPAAGASCHHYARLPWRLSGGGARPERAAPAFGADSRRVLREVARLAPGAVDALVAAGVVWDGQAEGGTREAPVVAGRGSIVVASSADGE
ncbi:MAG TPA: CoA transferase [Chloroflexota bacterium]|nr:CoA transferase [Chloroflexota bacterium]